MELIQVAALGIFSLGWVAICAFQVLKRHAAEPKAGAELDQSEQRHAAGPSSTLRMRSFTRVSWGASMVPSPS